MNATLNTPYRGYTQIELVEKNGYKWTAIVCGCGMEIEVYEDEFTID